MAVQSGHSIEWSIHAENLEWRNSLDEKFKTIFTQKVHATGAAYRMSHSRATLAKRHFRRTAETETSSGSLFGHDTLKSHYLC
jgi:hypothetical protein